MVQGAQAQWKFLSRREQERGRVENDDARDSCGVSYGAGQTDHAAPIVNDECHVLMKAEMIQKCFEVFDAPLNRVFVMIVVGFVGEAATDVVGHDAAVFCSQ